MKKAILEVLGRFCTDSNSNKSDPKILFGRPYLEFGRFSVSNIRLDDVAILFGCPSMSKSFE